MSGMNVGHHCQGGGAEIKDSPIHIHFHIYGAKEPIFNKIKRFFSGSQHVAIENADKLSQDEFQQSIVKSIENG